MARETPKTEQLEIDPTTPEEDPMSSLRNLVVGPPDAETLARAAMFGTITREEYERQKQAGEWETIGTFVGGPDGPVQID